MDLTNSKDGKIPEQTHGNLDMSQDLTGLKILMIAPCLGKFGGIETFCLTLCEDLLLRGASVRLMRKKSMVSAQMVPLKRMRLKLHLHGHLI